jgi:hypothetical protein
VIESARNPTKKHGNINQRDMPANRQYRNGDG